jgi:cation:H+ antiporter
VNLNSVAVLWVHFLAAALFVVGAGMLIGRVSGELGERLGLGRAWSGAVLLSLATTMPELVTTLTVTLRGQPGMAFGGIIGSAAFNLFILVVVDLIDPDPIYNRISIQNVTTGLLGCALMGVVITGLSLGMANIGVTKGWGIGHVGIASIAIFLLYGVGQYVLFQQSRQPGEDRARMEMDTWLNRCSLRNIVLVYLGLITVIVIAANRLGVYAEGIAINYRLGATFAGATLLGIVTSLPEITNAVACARQKEFDLAMGNVLGANAFVLVVLAVADVFYTKGRLFYAVSHPQAISALTMAGVAIVMQSIVLGALASRSAHRIWRVGVTSVVLAILYGGGLFIAYHFPG